jgi:putative transposase
MPVHAHHYKELYYQFVWATKQRLPLIAQEMEPHLYGYIRHKCEELEVVVYAVNGMPDHIHLVCSVPPKLAVTDFIQQVKGASAYFINHQDDIEGQLFWQEGYGVLTFTKSDLQRIVTYINNQNPHHREGSLSAKMEQA